MGFHHTDNCDLEDIKFLERVVGYFISEKQFFNDEDEDEIDFIEAFLYHEKDAEIYSYNSKNKYETFLKINKYKNEYFIL